MALWSNSSRNFVELDRKIEGSKLTANSNFWKRTTIRRAKRSCETNLETNEKARPQNKRPLTRESSALVSLDPKPLSVKKRLDSKNVNVN